VTDSSEEDVTTMMMYDMGRQYHAERIMTAAERRRADEQAGQLAAGVSRTWRRLRLGLTRPAQALRALRTPGVTISG
jgi:hypothetical protein